jgi:hypothetical protein
MQATPSIPSWIREFQFEGYTNVFDIFPASPRLYGTETLFGDWGAETLLLAKDAAPTDAIKRAGDWRHANRRDPGGWRTNERISDLAELIPGAKLYGSAAANMLYNDPRWSRSLKGFYKGPLHDYLVRVLQWTVGSMPNVRVIACLGSESWYLTAMAMEQPEAATQWQSFRSRMQPLNGFIAGKPVIAMPLYHPAARVSLSLMHTSWHWLCEILRTPSNNSFKPKPLRGSA